MRVGNRKLICILLVIMVSITGMCFEDNKTHSSFAYAQAGDADDNICVLDFSIGAEKVCTTKMLKGQNEESIHQLLNGAPDERNVLKFSLDYLCINVLSSEPGKFFSSSAVVSFHNVYADELVSSFVHKADGKK